MTATDDRTGSAPIRALQVGSTVSILVLLWQFLTAGQLLPNEPAHGVVAAHAAGALALHVVAATTALAAFVAHRRSGIALGPTILAVVVFAAGFAQAYDGHRTTLWVHIPGAMILTLGSAWLLLWALRPTRGR